MPRLLVLCNLRRSDMNDNIDFVHQTGPGFLRIRMPITGTPGDNTEYEMMVICYLQINGNVKS